jgi:LasA protease
MRLELLKVAAFIVGGLFFFVSGCSLSSVSKIANPIQVAEEPAPTKTVKAEKKLEADFVFTAGVTTTPSPIPTPVPSPTSIVEPMPIPVPDGPPFSYHTISEGETLSYIALLYGTAIEDLVAMNNLAGPSALIRAGQSLRVPVQTDNLSPAEILLPDSEVVYSPGYVDFDIAEFVNSEAGYLSTYHQIENNQDMTGAEIVERVAEQFSIGPRLLLALLEHYGGWVTNPDPSPEQLNQPLGARNPRGGDLKRALEFTANRLNAGYYSYKRDGFWVFHLGDRSRAITSPGLNAGTVGVQNILAVHADWDTWQQDLEQNGFVHTYRNLFGDPFTYAIEPIVPITLSQPPLALPWAEGQGFYFSGGPHAAFADGSAWAAIDFGPPDVLGNCFFSSVPSTAAAPGTVVMARQGEVQIDLDGDGNIQTGWVLLYLHVALDADAPLQVGQHVDTGDVIGYASCEGGLANSSHLHFARRYNGEWIEAGGPVPMEIGGWIVQPSLIPYEGVITNGSEIRESCECWDSEKNLIVNVASG